MATSNRANNDKMLVPVASPSPMIAPVPETHEVRAPPRAGLCAQRRRSRWSRQTRQRLRRRRLDLGRVGSYLGAPRSAAAVPIVVARARLAIGVPAAAARGYAPLAEAFSASGTDRYRSSLSAEEAHEDLRHRNLGCCARPPCRQRRLHSSLGPQERQLLMLLGRGTVCTVRERRKCVQFLLWCQHFP